MPTPIAPDSVDRITLSSGVGRVKLDSVHRYILSSAIAVTQIQPDASTRLTLGHALSIQGPQQVDAVARMTLLSFHPIQMDAIRRMTLLSFDPIQMDAIRRMTLLSFHPIQVDAVRRMTFADCIPVQPGGLGLPVIPIFPTLPYEFPLKIRPIMKTTIGKNVSDREIRFAQQSLPIWEIELNLPQLRDRTQNQVNDTSLLAYTETMQLIQLFIMSYGLAGTFAFDAAWDNSRYNQPAGTGDGQKFIFEQFRTWGNSLTEPVGMLNQIFEVQFNGVTVDPSLYRAAGNSISFTSANGQVNPPPLGVTITATFSFYYLCRFVENSQEFEEIMKNRWSVTSLKFRTVNLP